MNRTHYEEQSHDQIYLKHKYYILYRHMDTFKKTNWADNG